MSNTKHTPASWTVGYINEGHVLPENDELEGKGWEYKTCFIHSGKTILAEVKAMQTNSFLYDFDQFYANTKLIAAAPELLNACQQAISYLRSFPKTEWKEAEVILSVILELAIKKATE